ncbi:MAG: CinA family protein [Candidatus Planktophila sp.]|jgi:nicotinamide-nucleotide amidase
MSNGSEITSSMKDVILRLKQKNETLSTAESITGGGLGYAITSVPGSSEIYVGGSIAYHSEIKQSHLGVSLELIKSKTVYSEEVALEMAEGALKTFKTTWAIATTGVAGPDSSDGVQAGTVWVAIAGPITQSIQLALDGERENIRSGTVASAIGTFARILRSRD